MRKERPVGSGIESEADFDCDLPMFDGRLVDVTSHFLYFEPAQAMWQMGGGKRFWKS